MSSSDKPEIDVVLPPHLTEEETALQAYKRGREFERRRWHMALGNLILNKGPEILFQDRDRILNGDLDEITVRAANKLAGESPLKRLRDRIAPDAEAPSEPAHEPDNLDRLEVVTTQLETPEDVEDLAKFHLARSTATTMTLVGWPEWFLPLMKLRGFTYGDHRTAINDITDACQHRSATPELVVANFVAFWMPRRDQAHWECPVFGLWEDLANQIELVVKATPHRRAAVMEMASASVGPEYGCRWCEEGGFRWAHDNRKDGWIGGAGPGPPWPVVCDHTSRMAGSNSQRGSIGQSGPPWAWQPLGWDRVLERLKQRLPASVYTSWVMDLELLGFDDQVALVKCYNRTHATWVYRHLIETLRDALEDELEVAPDAEFTDLKMMMVWGGEDDGRGKQPGDAGVSNDSQERQDPGGDSV